MSDLKSEMERRNEINPKTLAKVIEILKSTSAQFTSMTKSIDYALSDGRVSDYKKLLRERANLLIQLPKEVCRALNETEAILSPTVMATIDSFALEADSAMAEGSLLSLASLPRRHEQADEAELERLIDILETKARKISAGS